jgi:hypothetical protein
MSVASANIVLTRKITGRLNIYQTENESDRKYQKDYYPFIDLDILYVNKNKGYKYDERDEQKQKLRRVFKMRHPGIEYI